MANKKPLSFNNIFKIIDENDILEVNKIEITTTDDDGIILNADLCLNNKRIKCLADPVDDNDIVTLKYVNDMIAANGNTNGLDPTIIGRGFVSKNNISVFTIGDDTNAEIYGNMEIGTQYSGSASNGLHGRAIIAGGYNNGNKISNIQTFNMLIENDNSTTSGNLDVGKYNLVAMSNGTNDRMFINLGIDSNGISLSNIDMIDMNDFSNVYQYGDLSFSTRHIMYGTSNGKNNRAIVQLNRIINYYAMNTFTGANVFGNIYYDNDLYLSNANSDDINNRAIISGGSLALGGGWGQQLQSIRYLNIMILSDSIMFGSLSYTMRCQVSSSAGVNEKIEFIAGIDTHGGHGGTQVDYRYLIDPTIQSNASIFAYLGTSEYGPMNGNMSPSAK